MSAALNAIFSRHRRYLLSVAMRIVRDPHTAEDLAQETYLRARRALDSRPIEHLESYLYQTARNLALDHQRRRKMLDRFEEAGRGAEDVESVAFSGASAEDALIEKQRQQLFETALAALPMRARQAWALSHIEGRTYQEIAEYLGVSRNTVYNDIKMVMGHCRDVLMKLERG